MTGQEQRDMLFARLFGFMSIIQSGLLVRSGSLPKSALVEVSTLSDYTDVLSQLIALGEQRSWLRESVWHVILAAIDILHSSKVTWKADAVETTCQQIFVEYKSWTPEKIAMALKMKSLYPEKDWTKIFSPTFKNGDLVAATNLQTLARIVKVGIELRILEALILTWNTRSHPLRIAKRPLSQAEDHGSLNYILSGIICWNNISSTQTQLMLQKILSRISSAS